MKIENTLLRTDSYKYSHHLQYPVDAEATFAYIESRGGDYDRSVFFGIQAFIKDYLLNPITSDMIDEAQSVVDAHVGPDLFNRAGWEYILDKYNGYIPITINAAPEGMVIPTKNVLSTIQVDDPRCVWLFSFLETTLLRAVWYPTTVATNSWHIKQTIREYLEETGDVAGLPFKLHDFAARGVSSSETAGIGGMSHLVNFMGTDTVEGLIYAREFYSAEMAGFSIPAAEHSTMTSWGGRIGEPTAMENMVDQFGQPGKMFAVVSDSYDIFNAVTNIWGKKLKQKVVDSGATLIIRPDSGDPVEITLKIVELLGEEFGFTLNNKGYKVLHPSVRIIQGDGIDGEMVKQILESFKVHGWSADNIAFGCGAGLLQKVNRDTLKFALKLSAIKVDGVWQDVYKDPITDKGKQSKKGRMSLFIDAENNRFVTTTIVDAKPEWINVLRPVYSNGKLLVDMDFEEVRKNSEISNPSQYV